LDISLSGKIGGRAVAYYMSTTLSAIILGIIMVAAIQPGVGKERETQTTTEKRNITTADTLMDLVRNLIPPNIIQATLQQQVTSVTFDPSNSNHSISDKTTWDFNTSFQDNTNILGLIAWSLVFGVGIAVVGQPAKPLVDFFSAMVEVTMRMTMWIIYVAPVGIIFLIAGQIVEMKDPAKTFEQIAAYFGTVIAALFIHGFIVLPTIFGLITKSLPFRYIMNMGNALFTAFGTASSSATLPVTIEAIEHKNNVDPRVTRFVLPIGATINMDGTALYEAVAAIFIAQYNGMSLGIVEYITISITATLASIGAAGIPQAGLVTMVMVLNTIGLPSGDIALILSVDWLLDRFRTTVNVLGDAIGAGIVYHLSKKELEKMDQMGPDNTDGIEMAHQKTADTANGLENGKTNHSFTSE